MNTATTTPVAFAKRVRIANDPRVEGRVIDIDPSDGWVMWVGDDHSCHISKPDYLEVVS